MYIYMYVPDIGEQLHLRWCVQQRHQELSKRLHTSVPLILHTHTHTHTQAQTHTQIMNCCPKHLTLQKSELLLTSTSCVLETKYLCPKSCREMRLRVETHSEKEVRCINLYPVHIELALRVYIVLH